MAPPGEADEGIANTLAMILAKLDNLSDRMGAIETTVSGLTKRVTSQDEEMLARQFSSISLKSTRVSEDSDDEEEEPSGSVTPTTSRAAAVALRTPASARVSHALLSADNPQTIRRLEQLELAERETRARTERGSRSVRTPAPPAPEKYSGEDRSPLKLNEWQRSLEIYLVAIGLDANEPKTFSYIISFTEGKAQRYLQDFAWPIVAVELSQQNATTMWTLDYIVDVFTERFVSPTAAADAEYEFSKLCQDAPGNWKSSADLAEEILSYSSRLAECGPYKLKERFFNALHPVIAAKLVEHGIDISDKALTYAELKTQATRCEGAYIALKRNNKTRRGGIVLPNSVMLSTSLHIADEPDKPAYNTRSKSWKAKGSSDEVSKENDKGKKTERQQSTSNQNDKKKNRLTEEQKETYKKEGRCFTCTDTGHVSRDCPSKKTATVSAIKVCKNGVAAEESVLIHKEIILNDVPVTALIDTGADHTFVSLETAKLANLDVVPSHHLVMKIADGRKAKVHGSARTRIKFLGKERLTRVFIANIKDDAIIGSDFLKDRNLVVVYNPGDVLEVDVPRVSAIRVELTEDNPAYIPTEAEREEFRQLIFEEFSDVLTSDDAPPTLPPRRNVEHTIPLIDPEKKMKHRVYKVADTLRPQVKKFYDEHVKAGIWVPAPTNNASPMIALTKKDGTLRPAIDLRERNANTHKMISFLPDQDEIIEAMNAAKFRASADVKGAFQQILCSDEDLSKNGISTIYGTVLSRVALQGDLNSANTCQMMMNEIFADELTAWLSSYVDDLFLKADTWKDFKAHVRDMLRKCRSAKIYLSKKKLVLDEPEMDILGRVLTRNGVKQDPKKIVAVLNYAAPKTKKQVQAFLGLVQYNARFIPRLAEVAAPISALTGDVPFRWSQECSSAFEKLKKLVAKDVMLISIDASKLAAPGTKPVHLDSPPKEPVQNASPGDYLFLVTDSSQTGAASVLMCGENWWSAKPIGYHSRKYNEAQKNYPVHEQEMLAALEGIRNFENRLYGREFVIITDNRSLSEFMKTKELTRGRAARWYTYFSGFAFTIEYIKGRHNTLADCLSRQYEDDTHSENRLPSEYVSSDEEVDEEFEVSAMTLRERNKTDIPAKKYPVAEAKKAKRKERKARPAKQNKLDTVAEHRAAEAWNPAEPDALALDPLYKVELLTSISKGYSSVQLEDKDLIKVEQKVSEKDIPMLYESFNYLGEDNLRLVVPDAEIRGRKIKEVLMEHCHATIGHAGAEKLKAYMSQLYAWKGMSGDIQTYSKSCPSCQACKPSTQKPEGLLHPLGTPTVPWSVVGMDFIGPLQISKIGLEEYDFLLVAVCHATNEVELVPVHFSDGATEIADAYFHHVYKHHGLPERIVSDRDKRFINQLWERLHQIVGTTLTTSTAFHPETNGKTERMNRTINAMMRQLVSEEQTNWAEQIPFIQFAINSGKSELTGYAPFEMTRGYIPRNLPVELQNPTSVSVRGAVAGKDPFTYVNRAKKAQELARVTISAAETARTYQANKSRRPAVAPEEGELRWLSTENLSIVANRSRKWTPKFTGPYKVVSFDASNDTVVLDLPPRLASRKIHPKFHIKQTKRYIESDENRFPGRLSSPVPIYPIDTMEVVISKVHSHGLRAVAGSGNQKAWHLLCQIGDKKDWIPVSNPDFNDQHLAVVPYLKRIKISSLSELAEANIPPPPGVYHRQKALRAKERQQNNPEVVARAALAKAQHELQLAKIEAETRKYAEMNVSRKREREYEYEEKRYRRYEDRGYEREEREFRDRSQTEDRHRREQSVNTSSGLTDNMHQLDTTNA